ncbi:alpha/beta hydrolase [Gilvimarinus sp. SDUM040013]|uniref:Alpha/beta hydrolase n=1 Tax=Gilvimarinus gilvus TaxID=3058038 RepID=A0ABU4S111_9GAMM|nr:alpha/beta hydrolase [Gilvimarinus sp. SDUM040013]MDO3388623.1 alpha/beta hydrolase [Gilvimarinus sp. SDUM040013]MDX6849518.1 alpha/beta hydrolase [Gilvimarinus sp. SDUM040013]
MKGLKVSVMAVLGVAIAAANMSEAAERSFDVEVVGQGKPMILIPGLNSSPAVWADLQAHYQKNYQLHLVHINGFAGNPLNGEASLNQVKVDLLDYIDDKNLSKPIMMGHSLGGFVSLWVASSQPEQTGELIIIDSLPFFPLAFNPMATEASMQPMAEQQRQGILNSPEQGRLQYYQQSLPGLVSEASDVETIIEWSMSSDPKMTGQAMYEMFTTDLRDEIADIRSPALVLGSWTVAKDMGGTMDTVRHNFSVQYENVPDVTIKMHSSAKHFIMLDDPQWTIEAIDSYLHHQP